MLFSSAKRYGVEATPCITKSRCQKILSWKCAENFISSFVSNCCKFRRDLLKYPVAASCGQIKLKMFSRLRINLGCTGYNVSLDRQA